MKIVAFLTLSVLMSDMVECMEKKSFSVALQPKIIGSGSHEYMSIYLSIVNGNPQPTSENIETFEKIAKTRHDLLSQTKIILGMYYLKHNVDKAEILLRDGLKNAEGREYAYYLTCDPAVKGKNTKKAIEAIKAKNPFSQHS
jgi:hypothetical protein